MVQGKCGSIEYVKEEGPCRSKCDTLGFMIQSAAKQSKDNAKMSASIPMSGIDGIPNL